MSFASANLIGRLVRDPELRHTGNDVAVTNFTIAVNRKFKDDEVSYFDVTAWRKLAELIAAHKKQGDQVFVSGELHIETWEGDKGTQRKPVVTANDIVFLAAKKGNEEAPSGNTSDEDIPF
jgi:single-strand DNA-binding protein